MKGGLVTKTKKIAIICVAVFAFLVALGITLYPLISTLYNEKHQSEILAEHQEKMEQIENSAMREAKENAIAYNNAIRPGAQETETFTQESLILASKGYLDQLNLTGDGIMGQVIIPSIQVKLPIYHGTEDSTLEVGVGHLLGSSLPVGGEGTHSILTAHSGMASQKMFSDLPQLKTGDIFYVSVLNETLAYQVDQIKTVKPHDTTHLQILSGEDFCTLVTCTPFGVNTHRLLVRGTRVPYEETETNVEDIVTEEPTSSIWVLEYIKGIIIGVMSLLVAVAGFGVYRRYRREEKS